MRYYENLFIVNPSYEGESLNGLKNQFVQFLEDNGSRIYNVEDWGKKRLAYKIDKQKYGSYILIQFAADGSVIRELEEAQRLNDSILGTITVRLNEEPDLSKRRQQMEEQATDEETTDEDTADEDDDFEEEEFEGDEEDVPAEEDTGEEDDVPEEEEENA